LGEYPIVSDIKGKAKASHDIFIYENKHQQSPGLILDASMESVEMLTM